MKRSVIQNMAKVLDCSPAYLMGWDEDSAIKTSNSRYTDTEQQIIERYRQSDAITKSMVLRVLDLDAAEPDANGNRKAE